MTSNTTNNITLDKLNTQASNGAYISDRQSLDCTICKKGFSFYDSGIEYSTPLHIHKRICKTCVGKAYEKLLGTYNEAEWVLYEK